MDAFISYIIKVNILISVFYLVYRLLLSNLSFFTLNRFYLASAILCSFIFPFIGQGYRFSDSTVYYTRQISHTVEKGKTAISNIKLISTSVSLYSILQYAIVAGTIVFLGFLIIRWVYLYSLINESKCIIRNSEYELRLPKKNISPFSFWNIIVFHFKNSDHLTYNCVLAHEKVHVKQLHSIDIMLFEISKVFCWFNPFFWLAGRSIKQNLEYIADAEVLKTGIDLQTYQLCLLSISTGKRTSFPVLNFSVAGFKKRLFQMNREKKSHPANVLKYLPVLPFIVLAPLLNAEYLTELSTMPLTVLKSLQDKSIPGTNVILPKYQPVNSFQQKKKTDENVEFNNPVQPVDQKPPEDKPPLIPAGATWHVASEGESINVSVSGTVIKVDGNDGYAEVNNRPTTYPRQVLLENFPDAILIYNGNEYPLSELGKSVDASHITQLKIYIGTYATSFGERGKKGVVIADPPSR